MGVHTGGDRAGSLAISALWVLFLIVALALAVSAHVSAHVDAARGLKLRTDGRLLAQAGVETASRALATNTNGFDAPHEDWALASVLLRGQRLNQGYFTIENRTPFFDGSIVTNAGLRDAESRINLNIPLENGAALYETFKVLGGADESTARTLSDELLDWKDADDTPRPLGRELGSQEGAAWSSVNGPMGVLEELLLLPSMSTQIFARIRPFVTVHGHGRVNINTASVSALEVLGRVSGGDAALAQRVATKIHRYRESGHFFTFGGRISTIRDEVVGALSRHEAGLTLDEAELIRRMVNTGLLSTLSTAFVGVSSGFVNGYSGRPSEIDFVLNGASGQIIHWHER